MPKHLPYEPGQIYFITSNVWKRQPIFVEKTNVLLLLADFIFYRQKLDFQIFAWVIMPDHFHWLIKPSAAYFAQFCADQRQRKGKYSHDPSRYYLSHIMEKLKSHSSQVINNQQMVRLWQQGFHDRLIRDEKAFHAVINYIHNNPVQAGLVDDITAYRWSSYQAMFRGDASLLKLDELD